MAEICLRAAEGLLEVAKTLMVEQLRMAGFIEKGRTSDAELGCLLRAAVNDVMTRFAARFLHQLPTPVQVFGPRDGPLHHVVAFLTGSLGIFQGQHWPAPARVLLVEGAKAFLEVLHDVSRVHGGCESLPFVADGASNLAKGMLLEIRGGRGKAPGRQSSQDYWPQGGKSCSGR